MADPELDHDLVEDDRGVVSIESPFLNFQFNLEETIEEYVNRITPVIATDVELHLGIHELQDRLHIEIPVHPNLQAFELVAPPSQEKDIEVKCDYQ